MGIQEQPIRIQSARSIRDRIPSRFNYNPSGGSGGNLPYPEFAFSLPLNDLGAGAVNTTLDKGGVAASFARVGTAWTKLSSGLWASVASGVARSCYLGADTAWNGIYGGYLAEAAGTQLVTPTASIRDMTNASWVKGATVTVAKTGIGIDGAANSCSRVTGGAVTGTNTVFQTLVAAASSRTYSIWLQRVTGSGPIQITQDGGGTLTDVSGLINANTLTRVSLTASVLNASFGIRVDTNGDVILADFNQFEAGPIATSPMDAAGAVRNNDILNYPYANPAQGTLYSESVIFNNDSVNQRVTCGWDDGSLANYIVQFINVGQFAGGGSQAGSVSEWNWLDGATYTLNAPVKIAQAWAVGNYAGCAMGGTVATDVPPAIAVTNNFAVGYLAAGLNTQFLNGMVRNIRAFNSRIPNYLLKSLTVPS